jgi:hypothetical protein
MIRCGDVLLLLLLLLRAALLLLLLLLLLGALGQVQQLHSGGCMAAQGQEKGAGGTAPSGRLRRGLVQGRRGTSRRGVHGEHRTPNSAVLYQSQQPSCCRGRLLHMVLN